MMRPGGAMPGMMPYFQPGVEMIPVTLTRLHVRYSADTFPEDLVFQETQDHENFQTRFVLQHAWNGSPDACSEARNYFENLNKRRETEADDARGSHRMEPRGRDQKGRPHAGHTAEAMVARHLGIVTQSDGARESNRPARHGFTARRGL